jgi:hypothetical protein
MTHRRRRPLLIVLLSLSALLVAIGARFLVLRLMTDRVEPAVEAGFHWPYYLYASGGARRAARDGETLTILVLPNNTRTTTDNQRLHDRRTFANILLARVFLSGENAGFLAPVFLRTDENWQLHTHVLDRDTLRTEIPDLVRIDQQLLAMVDDARGRLGEEGCSVDEQIAMWGYSASGMFVSRFVTMHSDRVRVAAIGSPGGWPIAPVISWDGETLRYPVGVADLAELTGEELDLAASMEVPQLLYLGSQDDNDSVPYSDGYDPVDRDQVFSLFGDSPVARWPVAESIYRERRCRRHVQTDRRRASQPGPSRAGGQRVHQGASAGCPRTRLNSSSSQNCIIPGPMYLDGRSKNPYLE